MPEENEAQAIPEGGDRLREVTISRLGHDGDGIAEPVAGSDIDGLCFIPYTLPGERVLARISGERGQVAEIITPSRDRVMAVCPHFGTCGGCAMQHVAMDAYVNWKTGLISRALSQHGLTTPLEPMTVAPLYSRRRAILGAKRGPHGVILGFHEPRGHRLVDIAECPILSPEIVTRLPALRELLRPLLPRFAGSTGSAKGDGGLRIVATAADNGVDVVIEGAGRSVGAAEREAIADISRSARLLRVSLDRDPIYAAAEPIIRFGSVDVVPPPGVFLQAVPDVERAMAERIVAAVRKTKGSRKKVADLFSGLGTFTFPIAAEAEVLAADSDKRALLALEQAHRRAQGVKPVTTLARDLHREPMSAKELDGFSVVVFDPPRAGASEQAERIARSKASAVVAVSCAPGSLARDLAILTAGGFKIESIAPFDQFLFSPHVEAIAILRRTR